jgi:hypothetical protein
MRKPRDDFDSAWKEMLEHYFQEFMAFFFPQLYAEIDWSRDLEFLDKELQYAVRRAVRGRHTVDKLVKVWLKEGEEAWILTHVEVQSQVDEEFPQRMYICNSLLFSRHKRCVISLGVLGDTRADWRPASFEYGLGGCRVRMEYPVVKLLDYEGRWEELEQSANPFAVVVMAHVKTQATRGKMETRLQWKKRILRWLYRQGRRYEEFVDLFRFMDLVMTLPPDLEQECEEAMAKYEEERKMPVLSHFERRAIEKGLQQGIVQATREGVLEVLHLRFTEPPPTLREQIQRLDDLAALKGLHRKAVTAGSLEEFEQEMLTVARE